MHLVTTPSRRRPWPWLLAAVGLLSSAPAAVGQKIVDTKVWTTFHKSARLDLPARYKTYTVEYDFGSRQLPVEAPPALPGLTYQASGEADLVLRIMARNIYLAKRNLFVQNNREVKNYHYELTCPATYGYELIDRREHTLLASYRGEAGWFATPDFKSQELLDAHVQNPAYLAEKAQNFLRKALDRAAYDLGPHDYHVELVVNSVEGSAPAYTEISQSAATFATLLSGPADKAKLAPLTAVWEKHLAKVNWDDKKSEINKNVANALLENLCAAYLLAEDYAKVRSWAQLYAVKNAGGMFSKAGPGFKGDETYTGPSTSSVLKGYKQGQPIYHSREEYLDFTSDLAAQ